MEIIQIQTPIPCSGLTIRTSNQKEADSQTAKIGLLWQEFRKQFLDGINANTQIFGIYHNYESDMNGEFDVTASIHSKSLGEVNTIIIPKGKYLVFKNQGTMPEAIIKTWQEVWIYFSDQHCKHSRHYDVDFEKYIDANTIELYIGIM